MRRRVPGACRVVNALRLAGVTTRAGLAVLAVLVLLGGLAACATSPQHTPRPASASTSASVGDEPPWPDSEDAPVPSRARTLAESGADACPPEFSGRCYPVWFGTNRRPLDPADPARGFGAEFDDHLHYGKRVVRVPASHRPGELGSPLWRRLLSGTDDRLVLQPGLAMAEAAFIGELRGVLGRQDARDRQVLVYIHGFNTRFDEAALRAAQLGVDLQVPGVTLFFSWPSRGQLGAYLSDLAAMEASEQALAEFLVRAARLSGPGRVHVIAHSMGNRGLLRAMHRATARAALDAGVRFGRIFLAAPDVDVELFRQLATVYPTVSERTTLYVGDQDRALAALQWLGAGTKVGGAPPLLVLPGIDTVHVHGTGLFRLGHSYVAEEPAVLRDIRAQLHWRETPERRRQRYGWPVPLPVSSGGAMAWRIGR